jgi:lysophospholipase L1-like esterase
MVPALPEPTTDRVTGVGASARRTPFRAAPPPPEPIRGVLAMPRLVSALASLALLMTLAVPAAARDAAPTVYLALGDSLAWGDGASVPAHTGYVPRLAGYFTGASHGGADELVNLAIRGETTGSFLGSQLSDALAVIGDPDTDVRVVTLSIGGNDLLDLINEETDECVVNFPGLACQAAIQAAFAGVATNLPAILYQLHAALAADPGDEKVFVLTLYNPFGGTGFFLEQPVDIGLLGMDLTVDCGANGTLANVGLNDIVACTALGFGDIVVATYDLFDDNGLTLTHIGEGFNIHPNDDGYALIAQAHRAADRAS